MKKNHHIQEELENISPFLAHLRQEEIENPKVPDGYFETIEDNIWARIKAEDEAESWGKVNVPSSPVPKVTWLQRVKSWLLCPQVGVSFALVLVAVFALNILVNPTVEEGNIVLTEEEIDEYLEENIDQFSESLLLEGMSEELADADISIELNIDDADIDAYLEENIGEIDPNLLEETW